MLQPLTSESLTDNTVFRLLLENGSFFRDLVEELPDMIFIKDLQGGYIYVNNAFATVVKLPKHEVVGHTDTDLFGEGFAAEIARHEARLVQLGNTIDYELKYTLGDEPIHFQSRKFLVNDEHGHPVSIVGVSRDVSLQRLAESKYRFIFDNAPIAFWEEDFSQVKTIFDSLRSEGVTDFRAYFTAHPEVLEQCVSLIRITDVNMTTMHMNRVSSKPVSILELGRRFTEDSQQVFLEELTALAEGRTSYRSEASTIEVDGERLDVLFHMNVLPGHEDELSLVLVSVTDISPLKRTEDRLSQVQALYKSVVEGQREMICRFLPSGRITFFNVAFHRFFAPRDPETVLFQDLFPVTGDSDCTDMLKGLALSSPSCTMEVRNYDAEGNMVWQQWSVNALFGRNGQVEEYQAVGTDITERKDTEERLAASEERWRSVFEDAEDLILTINSSGLILSANGPASEAAGQKLAGTSLTEILSKENAASITKAMHEVFQHGSKVKDDLKIVNGPFTGRVLSWVMTPIFHRGRVLTATIIARDITERRKLENRVREALIEGQESERKRVSRELHDGLGQLFTAIKLNMQHLRSGIQKNDTGNAIQRLKLLEQNVGVAIEEVKHISHNLMPDVLEQFGLRPALQDLVKIWNSAGDVNVSLEIVGMEWSLPAQTDLALFRMAQELITNSVRHSGASSIFVQLIDHTYSLVLMVEDDGKGFDTTADGGGFGLRNIRSRAELLDGTVDIDSAPGRGTVTTVEIPLVYRKP